MDQAERDYTAVIETHLGWRLGVFMVLLLTMLAAEGLRPRWPSNFGLLLVSDGLLPAGLNITEGGKLAVNLGQASGSPTGAPQGQVLLATPVIRAG
ncbi:hypothetical protein RM530_06925 [Algiphilus sp. W345]|uniref:Uncharacterized protein n=1 Tax=Banduia mediterranea TaxID=3075609 RepID=A0ABU2WHU9_9GAMM|nr:hypothetical protein [Algiphilus sp. W345]MDT0497098.1 hypothetical protein [Algiphilus sp. W345]